MKMSMEMTAVKPQYEDEHGNDCSQTTVNEGEDKVCIVKNYISYGEDPFPR